MEKTRFNRAVLWAAALLALAFVLRMIYEDLDNALLQSVMATARNTIHISLLLLWILSLQRRLVNRHVRRLLLAVGGLLLFWLVDKIVKWDFTGSETHPLVRYLWYGFYVGMLYIPTLGAFIIDYLGKPETYVHPKGLNYLLIIPTVLLLCVFTNDLHEQVFVFYKGIYYFDRDYGYDWLYYIVMAYFVVMGFYFVSMLLVKSRVPGSRRMQKMPLVIMGCAALFWIGYSMRLYDCDLTVTDCLLITLLLESAIQGGLLPTNTHYRQLFDRTTIPVQIVDRDFQPHYVSAGALPLTEDLLRQSAEGTVHLGDSLLSSASIPGGRVVWQDDITRLNALRQQLQDTREQLGEENTLLQAELELKEQRARTEEKNRLYDRIAREVEPQLIRMEDLLRRMDTEPENRRTHLARICLLGSYIKRRGNLLLLGEDSQFLPARELEYCIRESLENLRLGNVFTSLSADCHDPISADHIVAAYDFFEAMAEQLLPDITAMLVNLACAGGTIRMNLQIGCACQISPDQFSHMAPSCGAMTYEIMDEDIVMDLTIGKGGEAL